MNIKKYFEIEKQPKKGLLAMEWAIVAYAAVTMLIVLFCYTKLQNPDEMVWGRMRTVAVSIGLWGVYRLIPCQFTKLVRVTIQMVLLGWWYEDTYNINVLFPNLDHIVASWDQYLFHCQPALLFAANMTHPLLSEFLELSYVAYFPIIVAVCLYYFIKRYQEFEKCCFIIMASFFTFYIIFDVIPVVGPMYYYPAIGMSNVAKGVFPSVGNWFATHMTMMKPQGWVDGIGYQLLTLAHEGERPTGAFPSSHIGLTLVSFVLALRTRCKTLIFCILPLFVGICFATVYIRAHYVIDAIMGFVAGLVFYFLWALVAKRCKV